MSTKEFSVIIYDINALNTSRKIKEDMEIVEKIYDFVNINSKDMSSAGVAVHDYLYN